MQLASRLLVTDISGSSRGVGWTTAIIDHITSTCSILNTANAVEICSMLIPLQKAVSERRIVHIYIEDGVGDLVRSTASCADTVLRLLWLSSICEGPTP